MPSDSYRESKLKKLIDPLYASAALECSFEEAQKDGFVGGFLVCLEDVVEAASRRQRELSHEDVLRQQLYQKLNGHENPNLETITAFLQELGLTHQLKPKSFQLSRSN